MRISEFQSNCADAGRRIKSLLFIIAATVLCAAGGSREAIAQPIKLVVSGEDFTFAGPAGGPFPSFTKTYTITNAGWMKAGPLGATVPGWLVITGGGIGQPLAPGQSTTVTIAVNAKALREGIYSGAIEFTADAGIGASRSARLSLFGEEPLLPVGP